MRFLLINHIQNAAQSLRSNRMRTTLTMLGVTIGIASITAILALSEGASQLVAKQVDDLGGNIAVVRPGAPTKNGDNFTIPASQTRFATSTLTESDFVHIRELDHVKAAAPLMVINGSIKSADRILNRVPIVATTPELADIAQLKLRSGQFIDGETNINTAVLGLQASIDLFGTEDSTGQTLTIRGQTVTIIGVLKRMNDPINYNNIDFDNAAIVSLALGKSFNQGVSQLQQINIRADSVQNLPTVIHKANATLLSLHKQENDFAILSGHQLAQPTSQLFFTIASVGTAIAGISLIVGGIGIMNIMLVTVAERTREIGLRKSLGASNAHIVWQFLIESLAISIGGGITGYLLGYIVAFAISTQLTFSPVFTWDIAGCAAGISLIVGGIFGLYPAIRAARKDPIEALRQYN
ncbi:putative ABC transporter permease YknZ [compost metagenome]